MGERVERGRYIRGYDIGIQERRRKEEDREIEEMEREREEGGDGGDVEYRRVEWRWEEKRGGELRCRWI